MFEEKKFVFSPRSSATHEIRILDGKRKGVIRARKRYSFTSTCK
jgi:hypothetical protein